MAERIGVFVYGTLRPGGWNHEQWLSPLLAGPCRPARLPAMALHHHEGLPALAPADAGSVVVGDIADLMADRYEEGLALLDLLESTATDHYRRVQVVVEGGEPVWVWAAGARLTAELSADTVVPHGDWLRVPGAVR